MVTRYTSGLMLAALSLLAVSTAPAQSQSSQTGQGQVTGSAQAQGQGSVATSRSGATASGSGSSEAAVRDGDKSAALAGDSSVNAVLAKPVDSRKNKPGDPVSARTTQPARTDDGREIPKGSTLVGHVSQADARGDGQTDSALGIVFDKAVTRDGREIPLHNVAIRALAAGEGDASGSLAPGGAMMSGGGMGSAGMAGGRSMGGGGLVGRTTGAVGGTVGGVAGATGGVTGSAAGSAGSALRAGPSAVGGLDASGLLTTQSSGVFGLRDMSLAAASSSATQGSVVTSTGKSVRLDQGTRMLLGTQARGSATGDRDSSAEKPSADKRSTPDKH